MGLHRRAVSEDREDRAEVRKLEDQLKNDTQTGRIAFAAWQVEAKKAADAWTTLAPIEPEWIGGLAHPRALPDHSVITLGFRPEGGDLVVMGTTKMPRVTGMRLDALTHGDLPFGGPGRSVEARLPSAKSSSKRSRSIKPNAAWEKVKVADAVANFAQAKQELGEPWRRSDRELESSVRPSFWSMEKMIRRGAPIAGQDVVIKTSPPIFASKSRCPIPKELDLRLRCGFNTAAPMPTAERITFSADFGSASRIATSRCSRFRNLLPKRSILPLSDAPNSRTRRCSPSGAKQIQALPKRTLRSTRFGPVIRKVKRC